MTFIVTAIEKLSDWLAKLSAICLGLMTLLILTEIFLWNVFEATTLIADEYSAYGLAAIIFMGAGYCLKEKGHIRINLILSFLPQKVVLIITAVTTGITTIFMGYLWYYLYRMLSSTYRYNTTSGTLTDTPIWIPQFIMLIGAAGFLLQFFASTMKCFAAIKSGEEVF